MTGATVVRGASDITLECQDAISYIAGLLLDGVDAPADHDAIAGSGDSLFVLFHQGNGRVRAYIAPGLSGQHRFSGPNGMSEFLASFATSAYPWSEQVAAGTRSSAKACRSPCATRASSAI